MPSSKSASAKPVGSWTPFSFEHASQRFTFCILPSRICVRNTVASLHLQTSHNISVTLDLFLPETFNPDLWEHLLRRLGVHRGQAKIGVPVSRVSSRKRSIILRVME